MAMKREGAAILSLITAKILGKLLQCWISLLSLSLALKSMRKFSSQLCFQIPVD